MSREALGLALAAVGFVALMAGIALFYLTPLTSVVARLIGHEDASALRPIAIGLALGGLALGVLDSASGAGATAGKTETAREAELRRAHGDDGDPGDDLDFDLDRAWRAQ